MALLDPLLKFAHPNSAPISGREVLELSQRQR
jgi:hypothetical protein